MGWNTLANKQYDCDHTNIITGTIAEPGRNISREECTKCQASRPIITITADAETLEQARVWVSECVWGDLEPEDTASLSDAQIHTGINRHYAGGWAQFVKDGE
jgi:hypothetical protein